MIAAVKQMEAGRKAEDVAREVGVSAHTIYAWKSKYGGMDASEAQEADAALDRSPSMDRLPYLQGPDANVPSIVVE